MQEVTCGGELIAIFSQADHDCRKKHCHSHCQTQQDSCDCCNNETSVDGHVCLFSIASHAPVYVVGYPDSWDPKIYGRLALRYKWSSDSKHLMICWRGGDHSRMDLACVSKDALAERQVGHCQQACLLRAGKALCSARLPWLTQGLNQHATPADQAEGFVDLTNPD